MQSSEVGEPLDGFVFEQFDHIVADSMPIDPVPAASATPAELADVREMARHEGFAQGRMEGLEAARDDTAVAAQALAGALEEAHRRLDSDASLLEWQAVELGLQLADKVVGVALEVNPDLMLEAVKDGLRRLVDRERVTVLVNPADLDLVRAALGDISGALGGIERLDAEGERRVGRGEAMLTTPVGQIDMRIDTQLSRAREVLLRELAAPDVGDHADAEPDA